MAATNNHVLLNGSGIQFYFSGKTPDYIDDDELYNGFQGNLPPNHSDNMGNNLLPHELGHNFNLFRTFGFGSGNIPTKELVTRGAGANCLEEGDFICDTPADPFGIPGTSGFLPINGVAPTPLNFLMPA